MFLHNRYNSFVTIIGKSPNFSPLIPKSFMKVTLLYVVIALLFIGCQKEALQPEIRPSQSFLRTTLKKGITEYAMEYQGSVRKYTLNVPLNFNRRKTYPVVFVLKGKRGTTERLIEEMNTTINDRQYIGVYPETNDASGWNLGVYSDDPLEDVHFIEAILNAITASGNIKTSRVYCMGISSGGSMAHYLALKTSILAAICPIAGSLFEEVETADALPMNVLQIHGKTDDSVPYEGGFSHGYEFIAAQNSVGFWASAGGCDALPVADTSVPGAEIYHYNGCEAMREAILFAVPGLGHDVYEGFTGIDLNTYIFDFFDRHRLEL